MADGLIYLDPTAEPSARQDAYTPRLDGKLKAPRLALFANLYTDSTAFLKDLSEPVSRLVPGASFPYFDKQFGRYMSTPASPELKARIVAEADAVILAFGHCGSCTSGVIHDSVALAREGLPVVALVTERFREEAKFLARALGLPDLPIIVLPHPVAGREAAFQRALANAIASSVVTALTRGEGADASREPKAVAELVA